MKILHLDQNHPLLLTALRQAGFSNFENYTGSKQEIEEIIAGFDGIVIRSRFLIDAPFLEAAKNLKFIARVGAGLENIDGAYAQQLGIALIAAPEGNRNAVGEQCLGMLLALFNNLVRADREVKSGIWNRESNRGIELDGKTVGLIGYGNTGKSFAKKLKGFECKTLAYDIRENAGDENAVQVSLQELQSRADVVSLHVPLTPLTNRMVNRDFIEAFKKPFWLLNTARGKNVVTPDLISALKKGKILGAGLDVLEYEQLSFESLSESSGSFEELAAMDNVLLTPHIAGWTAESKIKLAETIAGKIIRQFG